MFATAQAVIQYEGACASRGDADTKPPRRLRALDCSPGKVDDTVALLGDRQPLDCFLTEFSGVIALGVRIVSAQPIYLIVGLMYAECHVVSMEMSLK